MKAIRLFMASCLLAVAASATAQTPSPAADYPKRLVRFLVPFPAGSGPEIVVRMMAEKLQKKWGQPVIVEGKPGANGAIAIDTFKKASTDGHDLLLLDGASLVLAPHLYKKLSYDPISDFDLVTPMFRTPFYVLVASPGKYKSVADIVAAAKASPGKLNYGSWGVGNFAHLGAAMLTTATDTKIEHVIYKDTNQLFMAVTTNEIDFSLGSLASTTVLAGRLKAIAVASPVRQPSAPDIPTVAESGGPAGFDVAAWMMFAAPKGLPPKLLDALKRDIDAALNEPDVKARLQIFGWETMDIPRAQIPTFIAAESAKYGALIRRAKISLD